MNKHRYIGCWISIIIIGFLPFLYFHISNLIAIKQNEKEQVGIYKIDLTNTDLGTYSKDSLIYKNLQISFTPNRFFHINMGAPFIYDTEGKWNAPGKDFEGWYWLWYREWGYEKYEENKGTQFSGCCFQDSTISIRFIPQEGYDALDNIYFKKIR